MKYVLNSNLQNLSYLFIYNLLKAKRNCCFINNMSGLLLFWFLLLFFYFFIFKKNINDSVTCSIIMANILSSKYVEQN